MGNAQGNFRYGTWLAKAVVLGALALAGTAGSTPAQETVGGHFTLNESARFGDTVLAAGQYKFYIATVGVQQSVASLQDGVNSLVQVVLQSEKLGAQASVLAMASGEKHQGDSNELILAAGKDGTLAKSLYMEKEGLLVNFRWATPKPKVSTTARATSAEQTAVATQVTGSR
jgi:hypothetical protein